METEIIKKIAGKSKIVNHITDEERIKIIKNMIETIGQFYTEKKGEREWNSGDTYDDAEITCPCGRTIWAHFKDKYSYHPKTKEERIYYMWHEFYCHIVYHIRMNGSKEHMDLLVKILGEKNGIILLEKFARKNMLVALALKNYIEELKNKEVKN